MNVALQFAREHCYMNSQQIRDEFSKPSTPLIADACMRLEISLRLAPPGTARQGRCAPVAALAAACLLATPA